MIHPESKIFLTGASGFVGSHILKTLLSAGYKHITCLKRIDSNIAFLNDLQPQPTWVNGDILDLPFLTEVMEGHDYVINAAAMVTFNIKNKKQQLETAISGTANMVHSAMDVGIKKFIHISSVAAIGRKKKEEVIDENGIFSHSKFDTTYGLSKFLSEQEVWRAHAEGLYVTILNPSFILGIGKWNQSSIQIFSKIYNGLKYYPVGSTGWVDVKDVSRSVLASLQGDFNGQRFIISSQNIPYKEVFNAIALQLGVKKQLKPLSKYLVAIVWRIEWLKSFFTHTSPIITKETVKSTSALSHYDNTKSIHTLGMTYTDIHQTIHETCVAFKKTYLSETKSFD